MAEIQASYYCQNQISNPDVSKATSNLKSNRFNHLTSLISLEKHAKMPTSREGGRE